MVGVAVVTATVAATAIVAAMRVDEPRIPAEVTAVATSVEHALSVAAEVVRIR
jgi:hypothetical protein